MKLKTTIIACCTFALGYYIATQQAQEPLQEHEQAFATIGLWQRKEFLRKLLEDARKKTLPTLIIPQNNQISPKK